MCVDSNLLDLRRDASTLVLRLVVDPGLLTKEAGHAHSPGPQRAFTAEVVIWAT